MKEVTIVIPVYDRERLIGRSLDSVYAQTHRPLKLIVVDNASTDGTRKAVEDWMDAHRSPGLEMLLLDETTPGAAAARNRGLDEVDTEYVLFHDSDDVMHPRLVEKALAQIGDADLVYWKAEIIGLDGRRRVKAYYTDDLVRRHFYNAILSTQVYMARTALVRNVGAWEKDAPVWNDWELGIRIALARPKAVALPEILMTIYSQAESLTGKSYLEKKGKREKVIDMAEAKIARSGCAEAEKMTDRLDYVRAVLAAHYKREGDSRAARQLLDVALARPGRSPWRKILLRLLMSYTAAGGRGAYYLWG